jgi:hypothetical protein
MSNVPSFSVVHTCENPAGDIIVHLRTSTDIDFEECLSTYGPIESHRGVQHKKVWNPNNLCNRDLLLHFFCLVTENTVHSDLVSAEEVERELRRRSLVSADFQTAAIFNSLQPDFADEHPHAIHKLYMGEWVYASFSRYSPEYSVNERPDKRQISISSYLSGWQKRWWWFAGVHTNTS